MADEKNPERGFALVDADGEDSPGIDFSTFVLSLATSALYHLGLVDDPQGGPRKTRVDDSDRALARQTIDTLEMISTKTQGNLDADEAHLLESILYDLHMRFVETRK
jgi:hypothetical protein